ncbi:adenylate kinase family protein [secondary endosymbiont of Heteropsylla cubana]|uniref:Adenylate kinase n=1 Tax=secondary endosymbiont of Heteropsylla cubana TaxID=134287 RepID=J3VTX0_9ENTR|nr:adenylate kinase [secondary endosymbiont of Heteropsylla cubana]AFP85491.1 adenylate kinase family protein [secondary endosymbiont of Heteropsylla cubana]
MRIMLLGPPGAGKGTQAQFIMKKYNISHISTGDMLRLAVYGQSKIDQQIKKLIDNGTLINDDLVIALVNNRIKQNDCRNSFLLDGFPRTLRQVNAMKEEGIMVDYVLELAIPDDLIIQRIVGRQIDNLSGRVYHAQFHPPKKEGKDDITGKPLSMRRDDREDTIKNRLLEYRQQTIPVIEYYRKEGYAGHLQYIKIDGTQSVKDISTELSQIFN